MGQSSPMDSKYNKSKARKDAIKPALAFFTGLGSVFLVLHYAFGNKPIRRLPPTQAQTALQSLQNLPGAALAAAAELPEAFRSFQGPTESQLRAAHFTMSQHDSVDCPRGSKPLDNPESCEIASEVLRVKYTGEQRFATDPTGCLYRTPDKDILWNQEQGGGASVVRKVVCLEVASLPASSLAAAPALPAASVSAPAAAASAPPAATAGTEEVTLKMRSEDGKFAITDTDANYCPNGSFALQSKEDCQLAAKSFSKGFLPDTTKEELEPVGCVFRGPDQDMLWNEDPEGSPHESRHVVCATAQFQREKAAAKAAQAAQAAQAAEVPAAPVESPAPVLTDSSAAAPPAPAPAAPVAPAATDAKFVFGSLGEVDCPPGAVPLSDQDQCEAAAKALSKEYVELNPAEGDPPGCQYRPPDQDVYFNSHDTGAPNAARQPVCREDPQAAALLTTRAPAKEFKFNYVMGESDTADCPAGGVPVESSEECAAAAKKLGKIYLGEGNPAEMDPKGCQFRVPDQDMYWNPHDTGATNGARQPVCREAS